jgi:NADH-quinone oxidoreductase subunit J
MTALVLAADNVNVAQNIAFGIIATVMIFAAFSVVTTKNVVHAALYLVVVLAGVAAQYILAAAEFVAVSQVMVDIGAVMVLFLFGIMLTRAQIGKEEGLNNKGWQLGIPVALLLFGLMAYVIIDTFEDQIITEVTPFPTEGIADQVLSPFLVPFLAISFVLLAAAIGAIVLARKD